MRFETSIRSPSTASSPRRNRSRHRLHAGAKHRPDALRARPTGPDDAHRAAISATVHRGRTCRNPGATGAGGGGLGTSGGGAGGNGAAALECAIYAETGPGLAERDTGDGCAGFAREAIGRGAARGSGSDRTSQVRAERQCQERCRSRRTDAGGSPGTGVNRHPAPDHTNSRRVGPACNGCRPHPAADVEAVPDDGVRGDGCWSIHLRQVAVHGFRKTGACSVPAGARIMLWLLALARI